MSLDEAERDISRIFDMIDYGERAMRFVQGMDEAGFLASQLHQDAVIRAVSVVGEAAYRVSDATRAAHPDIAWRRIAAMRHKLVHDYGEIGLDRVWATVRDELPALVDRLRPLLPPGDDG